ncbi:MAG: plastocyanin/azurin family copper-binding protein [Chloroflexales bacterium]
MSWRGSGNFRGSGGSDRNEGGSFFNGGGAGGPPLILYIAAAIAVGVIGLIVVLAVGASGGGQVATPAAPVATAVSAAAAPAATVDAAVAATAAAAAAAPATTPTPLAGVSTVPVGPALATGTGTPLDLGSDGDLLAFNKTTLEATAGTVYTVNFKNNSTAVQHNWVLVANDGVDAAVAAASAAMAKARNPAGAVPPGDTKGLLAAMPITNAGTTGTLTFKAPAAGTYTFLCTFPGHYLAGMVGQLTVK